MLTVIMLTEGWLQESTQNGCFPCLQKVTHMMSNDKHRPAGKRIPRKYQVLQNFNGSERYGTKPVHLLWDDLAIMPCL